jgi:hypothetical protein
LHYVFCAFIMKSLPRSCSLLTPTGTRLNHMFCIPSN